MNTQRVTIAKETAMNPFAKRLICILAMALAAHTALYAGDMDDIDILRAADAARGNMEGVAWEVTVTSVEGGRTTSMTLHVRNREHNFLAETRAPPRRRGDNLLFRDGNMWFHRPGLSKPVPISQRQRLLGGAAYGDIAATYYSRDYAPERLADETVDVEECYVFDLRAKTSQASYDRIVYWVSKERLVGVKADYYTVSGRKFKSATMEYDNEVESEDGETRPFLSGVTIEDTLTSSDRTVLSLSEPTLENIPYSTFNVNLFGR